MNKTYLTIVIVFLFMGCSNNTKTNQVDDKILQNKIDSLKLVNVDSLTRIDLNKSEIYYETKKNSEVIVDSFNLKNIGKIPLVLDYINTECDCTTLNEAYKKKIYPQDSVTIQFKLDTKEFSKGYNKRQIIIIGNFYPFYKSMFLIVKKS